MNVENAVAEGAAIEDAGVEDADAGVSAIAAAIAEPARTRMLFCLMDGHARTSTELAVVAGVSPSTASAHLARLLEKQLVQVLVQGKHRYHSLAGPGVAAALEALTVLAGEPRGRFVPNTPTRLRMARTCYDHMAGAVAVAVHDRMHELGWLQHGTEPRANARPQLDGDYELTAAGASALEAMGINVATARRQRRRFACACVDWSERRPHLGGALAAALLAAALKRRWVERDLDSRALRVTRTGQRDMRAAFQFAPNAVG
jgi:DNA-binding transcriptional ArsR family regulator